MWKIFIFLPRVYDPSEQQTSSSNISLRSAVLVTHTEPTTDKLRMHVAGVAFTGTFTKFASSE